MQSLRAYSARIAALAAIDPVVKAATNPDALRAALSRFPADALRRYLAAHCYFPRRTKEERIAAIVSARFAP